MATTLRNSQLATKFYGANNPGQAMTMIPKLRYMFYAEFVLNANAPDMDQRFLNALGSTQVGNISFKIKTIDKPKIDLTTVELNQYNRKRLIYTKTEYLPFTIKIHESVDGSIVQLWKDYFTYYFGDSRPKTSTDMSSIASGPAGPTFNDSSGWGLRPIAEDTNFFTRVNLYSLFGGAPIGTEGGTGQYQMTSYLNPRITAIDFEQYDISSSDTEEVSLSFKYEAIEYNPIQVGVLPNFGFTDDQVLDVTLATNGMSIDTTKTGGANVPQNSTLSNTSPATILPQGTSPIISQPSASVVDNVPPGYVNAQTGSTTAPGSLTNAQNFITSSVSNVLGGLNYGGPSQG